MTNDNATKVIEQSITRVEQKKLIRKALSLAHVTELEAILLVTEIYEDVKNEQS